jgi:hypothetical protein
MRKVLLALVPAVTMGLGLMTTHATAALSAHDGKRRVASEPARFAPQRAHYRELVRGVDNTRPVYGTVPQIVNTHREPGFVQMRGWGVRDPACNLPTSRCPDWQRDVQ